MREERTFPEGRESAFVVRPGTRKAEEYVILVCKLGSEEGAECVDVALRLFPGSGLGEDPQDGLGAGEAADDEGFVLEINLASVLVADPCDLSAEVGQFLADHDLIIDGGSGGGGVVEII